MAGDATIQAILLDFDGLMVDTESPIFELWCEVFRDHGQELRLEDWVHALGTQGGYDPIGHLARSTGKPVDAETLEREVRRRHGEACRSQPLLPGVMDLMEDAARAALPVAVASSSPGGWVREWLQHHGLGERIAAVCAREDVARVKPAPDLFLLAASRLGVVPSGCLVFEDSPNGILAAHAAGMRCVAVRNALTRGLVLPPSELLLDSLGGASLAEIAERLGVAVLRSDGGARPRNDSPEP
jgi:HAD superfamily hydrolase (TIGR01509 family)